MSATLPSWARVGAKVVCVDAAGSGADKTPLTEGATYTIRSVTPALTLSTTCAGIRLAEITNGICARGWEWHYNITRFRPLVDDEAQERDAAMFRKLLTTRQPVGEDA
jgi:hypothetical protein